MESNVLSERSETGIAVSIEVTPINKSRGRYYLIVSKEVLEQPPAKATVSYKRGEQSVKDTETGTGAHKKAQQSLLETQEQLKLALSGGSVGTWMWKNPST